MKILTLLCLAAATLMPQTRDGPARTEPRGTARIAGRVVADAAGGGPIHRAIVTLSGGGMTFVHTAVSDDLGQFEFASLPAGRYVLKAAKGAYITTEYGAKRPGRPGIAIAVGDAQQVTDLMLRLPRGAVISGLVTDGRGAPARNLQIGILPALSASVPKYTGEPATTATTDDRGAYRAFGLLPGAYFVVAGPRNFEATRNSTVSMSDAAVDAALDALRREYGSAASGGSALVPAAPPQESSAGYGPVFYPGTPVVADAMIVRVKAGEELSGVDITYVPTPMANISGIVTNAYGPMPALAVAINPVGLQIGSTRGYDPVTWPRLLRNNATGEFMFQNVPPGRYTVAVQSTTAVSLPPIGGGRAGAATPVERSPTLLWATADVTVAGADVSSLALSLRPAMRVSGRVVFDGVSTAPPADFRSLSVNLVTTASAGRVVYGMFTTVGLTLVPPTQVRADGTFESPGLLPGGYRVSSVPPSGWRLRSAVLDGRDVLDVPLDIDSDRDRSGLVLTYTDRRTELTGMLQAATGAPASDYFVIVFPADRGLWRPDSRRVQIARPGTDGRYSIRDLPAGEYLLAALTDVDPSDLEDPAFFEPLAAAAVKIKLAEGETTRQDVRLVR
jgi:hypothetical protein